MIVPSRSIPTPFLCTHHFLHPSGVRDKPRELGFGCPQETSLIDTDTDVYSLVEVWSNNRTGTVGGIFNDK